MFQILSPDGKITNLEALAKSGIDSETCMRLYELMLTTRLFGKKMTQEAYTGKMALYISPEGQEAAEVASALALDKEDWAFFYLRSQGAAIAKGVAIESLMKLFYGIPDDSAAHDFINHHVMIPYVLVGIHLPHASGFAWARKIMKRPCATIAYFGEGATSQGDFQSALNFSSVFKIPAIFFCENNGYAISTPAKKQAATKTFAQKAWMIGVHSMRVDGNDPFAVYAATRISRENATGKNKPRFIEAITYRLGPHTTAIGEINPPPKEEYETALRNEPLVRMKKFLLSEEAKTIFGIDWSEEKNDALKKSIAEKINSAAAAIYPMLKKEDGPQIVQKIVSLADKPLVTECFKKYDIDFEPRVIANATAREAINFAHYDIMRSMPNVVVDCEDAEIGSVFRTIALPEWFVQEYLPQYKDWVAKKFLPLVKIFGEERCTDTPLDESGIVGHEIGKVLGGLRSLFEIQFSGFVFEAIDQIIPELAHYIHKSFGVLKMPVVIRLPFGGGQYIDHHRGSEIAFFMNSPGLTIVCPSTVQDFYNMLWAAAISEKPVLFFEDKNLYGSIKAELKRGFPNQPIEEFGIRKAREGKDVTVTAYGRMVWRALEAAKILEKEGLSAEVFDLRVMAPLDKKTLIASLKKTGRLVTVHEENIFGGTGAEIVASAVESEAFQYLVAPPIRVAPPRIYPPPPPFWQSYEPQTETMVEAIRKSCNFR